MSRKIDTSDLSKLSEADRRYLQDRNQHIALGLPPLPVEAPQAGELVNTGDVNTFKGDPGYVPPGPAGSKQSTPQNDNLTPNAGDAVTTAYDDMTVKELRSEIDSRNESRDEEQHLSKTGTKAELIERLTEDDDQITEE